MLELKDVVKEYPGVGGGEGLRVLDGISLRVETGESMAVVGPSGSGKSTLLNVIGGLDKATSGQVLLDGDDLGVLGDELLAGVRNKRIGFVFQLHHLLPQLTVLENVLVPTLAGITRSSKKENTERAESLLERVGLADWSGHRPGELSGGQMQRVAVVRALINEPSLLLADEPTGSLDRKASDNVADLLAEMNESFGVTLITVTHSMELAERMGKVLKIEDGQLV